MEWLLCLTTKVLYGGRIENEETKMNRGRRTMPEYQLIASFLSRVSLKNVKDSLKWIQNNVIELELN